MPAPLLRSRRARACLVCLVPWLGFAVASLLLLSLAISGQMWMFGNLGGLFWWDSEVRGAGPPVVKWSEFDVALSSSPSTSSKASHVVASIARFWGRDSVGTFATSFSAPMPSAGLRMPRGRLFLTLVGNVSWLHQSFSGEGIWAPYPDASLRFQFRAKDCPSGGGGWGFSPNAPSGQGDVHVVVLGNCPSEDGGLHGLLGLYLEAEQATARAESIRHAHSSGSAPVIVHSLAPPPLPPQSHTITESMSWEQRRSVWWGWEALSGRLTLRGGARLFAAPAPAAEARQLQAFLAVSHLAARWGVLPVWPHGGEVGGGGGGRAEKEKEKRLSTLQVLLAQLRFLQDQGALLSARTAGAARGGGALPLSLLCGPLLLTRKHHAECVPQLPAPLPLLLTSLGGAGTHGTAARLQQAGAAVQHEGLGRVGAVAWMYAVNDAALRTSYPFRALLPLRERSLLSPRFRSVVHLVRHPLRHLASFAGHLPASHDFVRFVAAGVGSALQGLLRAWTEGRLVTGPLPGEHALSTGAREESLHRMLALASAVVAVPQPAPPGPLFPALSWLFWDALVDLQADSRLVVEGGEGLQALAELAAGAEGGSAEAQEASLLHGMLAAAYAGYNQLAGTSKPRIKRLHGSHSEVSWADLAALAPCPSPGHAPVQVERELRARAALYGYDVAT